MRTDLHDKANDIVILRTRLKYWSQVHRPPEHLELAQSLYVINIFARTVVAESYTLARTPPTPYYPHSLNTIQHTTLPCGTLLGVSTRKGRYGRNNQQIH